MRSNKSMYSGRILLRWPSSVFTNVYSPLIPHSIFKSAELVKPKFKKVFLILIKFELI